MCRDPSEFARLGCEVAIVDVDQDIEQAVHVIEGICTRSASTTVMACSAKKELALVRRAMQAGARDFLPEPVLLETMKDALARISFRRIFQEQTPGKVLVFTSSKAGVGVTSLAANFAIALTRESASRVVVVDLDLHGGDIALGLGLTASCSVADALSNPTRLDRDFVSTLLMRHTSGLQMLASPDDFNACNSAVTEGATRLFQVLREEFDYVVVDNGRCGSFEQILFDMADKLYLVTELSFPSVRNAHRMISCLNITSDLCNLEVVLNRCDWPHGYLDETRALNAVGRPVSWKIPNGFDAVPNSWDNGVPLAMGNSPFTNSLVRMARAARGKPQATVRQSKILGRLDAMVRGPLAEA